MFTNFWLATELPSIREQELILGAEGGEPEDFVLVDPSTPLEVLARDANVFASASTARKAGLKGPVPHGLCAWGTKRRRFFTYRPIPHDDKVVVDPAFDKTSDMLS